MHPQSNTHASHGVEIWERWGKMEIDYIFPLSCFPLVPAPKWQVPRSDEQAAIVVLEPKPKFQISFNSGRWEETEGVTWFPNGKISLPGKVGKVLWWSTGEHSSWTEKHFGMGEGGAGGRGRGSTRVLLAIMRRGDIIFLKQFGHIKYACLLTPDWFNLVRWGGSVFYQYMSRTMLPIPPLHCTLQMLLYPYM